MRKLAPQPAEGILNPFLLLASFLLIGCSGTSAPVVEPPPAPTVEATVENVDVRPEFAPTARAKGSDGRVEQCKAGGARACLSLCGDRTAVCVKDSPSYDKKDCQKLADSIPPCSEVGGTEPGSLCKLAADQIAPTQGAVGMFAADCKATSITDKNTNTGNKLKRYLAAREIPAVRGPGGRYYITDRHHLSTGILKSDIQPDRKNLSICLMADRSDEDPADFWDYMVDNRFTWLYNRKGEPITYQQLPPDLASLGDDPYRTLSRWVRNSCGYVKCGTVCGEDGEKTMDLPMCRACPVAPFFLEFKWANFMRDATPIPGIYELPIHDQATALREHLVDAMNAVASSAAIDEGLPGWNHSLIETKLVAFDASGCEE